MPSRPVYIIVAVTKFYIAGNWPLSTRGLSEDVLDFLIGLIYKCKNSLAFIYVHTQFNQEMHNALVQLAASLGDDNSPLYASQPQGGDPMPGDVKGVIRRAIEYLKRVYATRTSGLGYASEPGSSDDEDRDPETGLVGHRRKDRRQRMAFIRRPLARSVMVRT